MTWHHACASEALEEEGLLGVAVAGRRIALYRVAGRVYATDDQCPHGYASLSQGWLDGHCVECPLHQGLIDIRNGQPAGGPIAEPVRVYPAREAGGAIEIEIA